MPEKKYIDADIIVGFIDDNSIAIYGGYEKTYTLMDIRRYINAMPAADVAEVRHSVWEYLGIDKFEKPIYQCKNCKCNDRGTPQYCPNCGARMDGGNDNA